LNEKHLYLLTHIVYGGFVSVKVETKVVDVDLSKGVVSVLYRTVLTTTVTRTTTVTMTKYSTPVVATAVTKVYTHPLTTVSTVVPTTYTLTVIEEG